LFLVQKLDTFHISYIPREKNKAANELAQQAPGFNAKRGKFSVRQRLVSCGAIDVLAERHEPAVKGHTLKYQPGDWRQPLQEYIENLSGTNDRKLRRQALKYTILDGEVYRRTVDGMLLNCLDDEHAKIEMGEVHEGLCGTHQFVKKMKWMIRRAELFWPTMVNDCFKYFRGCEGCQRVRDVQSAPASMLHPIIKSWPFWGCGLDFVGEIHRSLSKGHRFILVAINYFTKCTEAVPLKNMTHKVVISFVLEDIMHRFGLPQTLTMDQGASFMSHQFKEFVASIGIKLLNSSCYHA
jgi:hypothetical protein